MPEQINIVSKLRMWKQQIEYESIPFACFHCKKAGHWAKSCPLKPKGELKQAKLSAKSKMAPEKKVWQVKNSENKEAHFVDYNCFGPLGENKEVVSSTSISNLPTQEVLEEGIFFRPKEKFRKTSIKYKSKFKRMDSLLCQLLKKMRSSKNTMKSLLKKKFFGSRDQDVFG